jgi:hypothetical protein
LASKWVWYAAVGVPTALLIWGLSDENSPPAKFTEMIGLTGFIHSFTDEIAKPSHEKLLPDWSQVSVAYLECCFVHDLTFELRLTTVVVDAQCAP